MSVIFPSLHRRFERKREKKTEIRLMQKNGRRWWTRCLGESTNIPARMKRGVNVSAKRVANCTKMCTWNSFCFLFLGLWASRCFCYSRCLVSRSFCNLIKSWRRELKQITVLFLFLLKREASTYRNTLHLTSRMSILTSDIIFKWYPIIQTTSWGRKTPLWNFALTSFFRTALRRKERNWRLLFLINLFTRQEGEKKECKYKTERRLRAPWHLEKKRKSWVFLLSLVSSSAATFSSFFLGLPSLCQSWWLLECHEMSIINSCCLRARERDQEALFYGDGHWLGFNARMCPLRFIRVGDPTYVCT